MDLNMFNDFISMGVVLFCLGIGYVIKNSLDFIPNKYIPLIMATLGIILAIISMGKFNFNVVLTGLTSGLASTGLNEAYKHLVENK